MTEMTAARCAGKHLVFGLGGEEYCVDVARVREIIGPMPITRVPHTPDAVRGVINLRGKVIPVVDLRVRFGLEAVDHGRRTCIVVVEGAGSELGLVVDRVTDVVTVADADVEDVPAFGPAVDTDYLAGIAKDGSRVRLILDAARLLANHELAAVTGAAGVTGG